MMKSRRYYKKKIKKLCLSFALRLRRIPKDYNPYELFNGMYYNPRKK